MTDRLPPALASWTGALSALTPAFTVALGPLLRGLDDLVATRVPRPAADGEPDGYDGLSRGGPPHRLLASQWLLADELPEVTELELSPVVAGPDGVAVVNARVRVSPHQPQDPFLRKLR